MRALLGISVACLVVMVILTFGPVLWETATDPCQPWRLRGVVWMAMAGGASLMLAGVVRASTKDWRR